MTLVRWWFWVVTTVLLLCLWVCRTFLVYSPGCCWLPCVHPSTQQSCSFALKSCAVVCNKRSWAPQAGKVLDTAGHHIQAWALACAGISTVQSVGHKTLAAPRCLVVLCTTLYHSVPLLCPGHEAHWHWPAWQKWCHQQYRTWNT